MLSIRPSSHQLKNKYRLELNLKFGCSNTPTINDPKLLEVAFYSLYSAYENDYYSDDLSEERKPPDVICTPLTQWNIYVTSWGAWYFVVLALLLEETIRRDLQWYQNHYLSTSGIPWNLCSPLNTKGRTGYRQALNADIHTNSVSIFIIPRIADIRKPRIVNEVL